MSTLCRTFLPVLGVLLSLTLAFGPSPLAAQATDPSSSSAFQDAPPDSGTPPVRKDLNPQSSSFIPHAPKNTPPPKEISDKLDVFYKALKAGSYSQAYEGLLANTRLGTQKDKLSIFISKTESAFGIYGQLNDYELYDNYPIGSNVLVLTYLSRHSLQPLRWRFIYYRADTQWQLINLGFDDNLLELLD
jgi:hypothetical protein